MTYNISDATKRNWQRLNIDNATGKLRSRANKSRSKKSLVPIEYCRDPAAIATVKNFAAAFYATGATLRNAVFTICSMLLERGGLHARASVQKILADFKGATVPELLSVALPEQEPDPAGLIYQALRTEGEKIRHGSYYTPPAVVADMMKKLAPQSEETILDPCCGSGAFLLAAPHAEPELLFGVDSDPTAVLIAKTNLLLKFPNRDFIPNIIAADFLCARQPNDFPEKFNCVIANPPWGAGAATTAKRGVNETFSIFLRRAFDRLSPDGRLNFLLPESALNIKAHRELREFLLRDTGLTAVTAYPPRTFTGVTTSCVGVLTANIAPKKTFVFFSKTGKNIVKTAECLRHADFAVRPLAENDAKLLKKIDATPHRTLAGAEWGLGIVTGDNRGRLLDTPIDGAEAIVTGRELRRYTIIPPRKYIFFDREKLQQAAPDRLYRADEKLLYKFISQRLVFAYDNQQTLCLNSANIMIPHVPGLTIKAVLALLNSSVLNFFHRQMSGTVKVIKNDLLHLPIPEIDADTAEYLDRAAAQLIITPDNSKLYTELDRRISKLFDLTTEEHERVVAFQSAR